MLLQDISQTDPLRRHLVRSHKNLDQERNPVHGWVKVPSIAKPLKEMVGTRRLQLLTSTRVKQPAIDSKGVNNRRNRQNRNTRRNLLPNCYQNMASGFGGRIVGDRPLCFHT